MCRITKTSCSSLIVRRKAEEETINRTSWELILKKYSESIGPVKKVIIVFKNARDQVSGLIKEIDEDFLVLENYDRSDTVAIVELDEIAGFRTS